MPWIKRQHVCREPAFWQLRRTGSVWQCPRCRTRWQVRARRINLHVIRYLTSIGRAK